MSRVFADTHPEMEALQIKLLRQAPPWRKLEMVWQLNAAVQALALSGLKARYPDDSPEKLRRRLADLLLGKELATQVYGSIEQVDHAG
jgi:hypothetical protein